MAVDDERNKGTDDDPLRIGETKAPGSNNVFEPGAEEKQRQHVHKQVRIVRMNKAACEDTPPFAPFAKHGIDVHHEHMKETSIPKRNDRDRRGGDHDRECQWR